MDSLPEGELPSGAPPEKEPGLRDRDCTVCGARFKQRVGTQRMCSPRCRQIMKSETERQKLQAHRRNYKEQFCRRCTRPFLPTTGRVWFCFICQALRRPVSLSIPRECVVCGATYTPKISRQRSCLTVACQKTLHNAAEQRHWVRRGAARQHAWYWERGGKEAKSLAHAAKQADSMAVAS